MNKIYRVVWNAETGQWVVASEMAKGRKKRASSASVASVLAIGACALAGMPSAHAGTVMECTGSGNVAYGDSQRSHGSWVSQDGAYGEAWCNGGSGVVLSEANSGNGGMNGSSAWIQVGQMGSENQKGEVTIYGPGGITMRGDTDMTGHKITGLAAGSIAAGSTDAITGDQFFKLQNGGTKYFHANSTAVDSSAATAGSIAVGGKAVAGGGAKSIAIGENASSAGDYTAYESDGAYNIAIGGDANANGSTGNWGHNTAVGGEAALGVGVSRWSDNGRVNFNAGVSAAKGDEPVFRVGVGYVF